MAQHDYSIANQSGAAFRADLNNALSAIVSQNSGAAEPSTTFAYQLWADTTAGVLKIRNAANSAWVTLRELDGTLTVEDGSSSTPGLAFASDLNTGIYRIDADRLGVATSGTLRLEASASGQLMAGYAGAVGTPTFTKTDDGNTGLWFPAADTLAISTAGAEVARATSDAYLRMAASTGGIQFNGDTAAANALDDYEEGTWTATLGGSTSESGQTYLYRTGSYVKVGKKVTVELYIEFTSGGVGTVAGNAVLKGLPFSTNGYASAQIMWNRTNINFVEVYLYGVDSTTLGFHGATAAGTGTNNPIAASDLYGSQFQVITSFSYLTS